MRYKNTTYAFVDGLEDILAIGKRLNVRGSEIIELRNRTIVIEQPRERCIILPGRYNNIFASIAETMWVLAGRNDLAFLSRYLPRAKDFSDDGHAWRAAYGPRLRNWYGVDQIRENVSLLSRDLNTRRAVISIFDPAVDFSASKDIPCNNWIHWLVREGRLHMNIAIRSNDVMWGFSGINTFEWSVLQELMAFWLGTDIGETTLFASSFHLYTHHEQRAKNIVERFPGITCYEASMTSPRFQTSWNDFDDRLQNWFDIEAQARIKPESVDQAIWVFPDPLLRHFLELIQIYNGYLHDWPVAQLDERLKLLPETDLTAAAYEYFHRKYPSITQNIPHPAIAKFWAQYIGDSQSRASSDSDTLRQAIIALHTQKTAAYGPSWKRRGEQISIMSNVARKVDRLEQIAGGAPTTRDESLVDTVIDLFVYCIKYQTFLADNDDAGAIHLFRSANPHIQPPYSDGVEAFNYLIMKADFTLLDRSGISIRDAAADTIKHFQELEVCFTGGTELPPVLIRLERVQQLTEASIKLVAALKREQPRLYRQFLTSCLEGSSS